MLSRPVLKIHTTCITFRWFVVYCKHGSFFSKISLCQHFLWINSSTFLPLLLLSYFIREEFSSVPGLLSQIPLSLMEFQGGNTLMVQNSYGMLKQFFTFKSLKITEDRLNLYGDCRCVILVPT